EHLRELSALELRRPSSCHLSREAAACPTPSRSRPVLVRSIGAAAAAEDYWIALAKPPAHLLRRPLRLLLGSSAAAPRPDRTARAGSSRDLAEDRGLVAWGRNVRRCAACRAGYSSPTGGFAPCWVSPSRNAAAPASPRVRTSSFRSTAATW